VQASLELMQGEAARGASGCERFDALLHSFFLHMAALLLSRFCGRITASTVSVFHAQLCECKASLREGKRQRPKTGPAPVRPATLKG